MYIRVLQEGNSVVSCVTCGTSLPEGATVCTVCEPWAVPAADADASVLSTPSDSALPVSSDVPKWIIRLARRHRPANVGYQQLERAWRNTKVSASILLAAYGLTALAIFSVVVKLTVLAVICIVLAMVGYIAGLCFAMTVKRKFWLGRAVALAGAQPALGYAGLASIPGIAKLTASLRVIRVVSVVVIVVCVFVTDDRTLPQTLRESSWSVYFVYFIGLSAWNLRVLAEAHKELAGRLTVRR